MATITGTVVEVEVSQYRLTDQDGDPVDFSGGRITVQPAAGGPTEKLNLWTNVNNPIPDRITQSIWVSICRDALANGNEVLVTTSTENSATVTQISLRPPS